MAKPGTFGYFFKPGVDGAPHTYTRIVLKEDGSFEDIPMTVEEYRAVFAERVSK